MAETCVFCGRPIQPDEERTGRPPNAAHATCADAALASDEHWDAIAAASGDTEPADEAGGAEAAPRPAASRGCLVLLLPTLGGLAAVAGAVAAFAA